ncbi:S8 family serine peptidase [Haliangium ochraceum]|uniref:S8 family serine peptidase n=1 Tax=Haliangium ochraceum TaxID=80816 RepID=UPI0018F018B7|nr:S8 family serine peptidase [Haliangium ochraceum]
MGALAVSSGCTDTGMAVGADEATFTNILDDKAGPSYDPSTIIVKFRDVATATAVNDAMALVKGSFKDENFDGKDDQFAHIAGGNLAAVKLDDKNGADAAIKALAGHPAIEYAERNYLYSIQAVPNDPDFGDLWGLNNTGQGGGTPGAHVSALDAWDLSVGSHDVIVGVIDTGVAYDHPDLVANMYINPGEIPGNGIDDDENGFIDDVHGMNAITGSGDPYDDNDHGTHVSGTIGASGDNGVGVVGVNWDVTIMGLKFLSAAGSGSTEGAIACIDYAVMMKNSGVDIRALNNSWGGGGFSQALEDAIAAADAADILFVAAAGNSNSNNDSTPSYPASYEVPNVLAVASTTRTDARSSFSSYGATSVDLGAPGSDILSTIPGGGYASFSGTSMATPHVTGAAALALAASQGSLSTAELKDLLMNTGDPIASMDGVTVSGKRLNLANLLAEADPQPGFRMEVPTTPLIISQGDSVSLGFAVSSVLDYSIPVDMTLEATPALDAEVVFTPNPVPVDSSGELSITTSTATAPGTYSLVVNGTSGELLRSRTLQLTVYPEGTTVHEYETVDGVSIPDNDPAGVTSTLSVPDSLEIIDLTVDVNITHTYIGDLIVELTSPAGTTVRLHDRAGGGTDNLYQSFDPADFDGESAAGEWTLFVSDNAGIDLGTIDSWGLTIVGLGFEPGIGLDLVSAERRGSRGADITISWSGSDAELIDVYRYGVLIDTVPNTDSYRDRFRSSGSVFIYQVCEAGTDTCSQEMTVTL